MSNIILDDLVYNRYNLLSCHTSKMIIKINIIKKYDIQGDMFNMAVFFNTLEKIT